MQKARNEKTQYGAKTFANQVTYEQHSYLFSFKGIHSHIMVSLCHMF